MSNVDTQKASLIDSSVSIENIENDGSLERLERLLNQSAPKLVSPEGEEVDLPQPIYELLHDIVQALIKGEKFSFVPENLMLSTTKAAALLNVSRPYLIKLLDSGQIPSAASVGTHRRVRAKDVISYKERRDSNRRESVKNLSTFMKNEGFYEN